MTDAVKDIDFGGSAFPCEGGADSGLYADPGMTLRDWFAGQALAGFAANNAVTVTCVLSHEDGHSEETTLSAPSDTTGNKNAIQAIGSTITYLSRYSLMASLGLSASEDDDGRSAGRSEEQNRTITPEQVKTVLQLIEETESDIAQFCQMGKIHSVADMLASQFDSAVRLLNQKKAKLGQRVAS